jgi:hypothetical protein
VNRLAKSLSLLDEGKIVEALDVDNYYLHRDWCAEQLKETASSAHPCPPLLHLAPLSSTLVGLMRCRCRCSNSFLRS